MNLNEALAKELTLFVRKAKLLLKNIQNFESLTHRLKGGLAFFGYANPVKELKKIEISLSEIQDLLSETIKILEKIRNASQK